MRGRSAVLLVILLALIGVVAWLLIGEQSDREGRRGSVVDPQPRSTASRAELESLAEPEAPAEPPSNRIEPEIEAGEEPSEPEALPAILRGPAFALHVRDRQSHLDLTNVEVRCLPRVSYRAAWQVPVSEAPALIVARDAISPIDLLGWRHSTDEDDQVRGLEVGATAARLEMEAAFPNARGLRFYARAPGYAWGSTDIDPGSPGEREILLDPESVLAIGLSNRRHKEYDRLGRELVIGVWRGEEATYQGTVHLVRVSEAMSDEILLEGLEAGTYLVSAQLREQWHQSGTELALARAEVPLGGRFDLSLPLADPPAPETKAPMAGTITFPQFEGEESLLVRFHPQSSAGGSGFEDPFVRLVDMQRVGDTRTWRWSVGEVPAGLYQAKVWPLLESFFIELPKTGLSNVALRIPEIADVRVETVDAVTGDTVSIEQIFWTMDRDDSRQVNHLGAGVSPGTEPGHFRFFATPGKILLRARPSDADPRRFAERYEKLDLVPGRNDVRLKLQPFCGLKIFIYDGEALLPRSSQPYLDLRIQCQSGEGRVLVNAIRTENLMELSESGLYEVALPKLSGDYRPWTPKTVEIRAGETTELEIRLERR